jgi:hypothetical protein
MLYTNLYTDIQKYHFSKLLEDPSILDADKAYIKNILIKFDLMHSVELKGNFWSYLPLRMQIRKQ